LYFFVEDRQDRVVKGEKIEEGRQTSPFEEER